MSRGLILILLCSVAYAKPGEWGEDPRVVPDFAPIEERRAPKMPEAEKVFTELAADRTWDRLDDGLMVCHLQVGATEGKGEHAMRAIATFGLSEIHRTNATVRLTVNHAPTVALWGPLLHDASYVSIPALTLAPGDKLIFALSDRTMHGEKPMGRVAITWDGKAPIVFQTSAWEARCVLTDHDDAVRRAKWWLDSIDRQLDAAAKAKPDRSQPELGRPTKIFTQLRSVFTERQTREGNFRYAAGFIGWAAPEIQQRLQHMRDVEATWETLAAAEVSAIAKELSPAPLMLGSLSADARWRGEAVALRVASGEPQTCRAILQAITDIQLVDAKGRFHETFFASVKDRKRACSEQNDVTLTPPIDIVLRTDDTLSAPPVLLHAGDAFTKASR